jgi:hypothetical protein
VSARIGSREWLDDCADMYSPDDDREEFREPRAGEVACDECEQGVRHWMEDVREGYEVCTTCNGSGCVLAPKAAVHPIFVPILAAIAPKDEAA